MSDDRNRETDRERDRELDTERMNTIIKAFALNGGDSGEHGTDLTPNDVHYERLRSLVTNVTLTALNEIGELRDECGELIRTVNDRQETLLQHIHAFSVMAKGLLDSKKVMAEALHDINAQFKSLPLAPTLPHAPQARIPGKPSN